MKVTFGVDWKQLFVSKLSTVREIPGGGWTNVEGVGVPEIEEMNKRKVLRMAKWGAMMRAFGFSCVKKLVISVR
jgi:hypothetical protein